MTDKILHILKRDITYTYVILAPRGFVISRKQLDYSQHDLSRDQADVFNLLRDSYTYLFYNLL